MNPLGVQQDGVRTEGAASPGRIFGGNIDTNPDYLYQSRGRVNADGYVVEVRVPFKSLRYPGGDEMSWGLQVERRTQRTGYTDTWTDVRRASASFLLQAGTITGLHDLRRGVVLEVQPVLTATANGLRQPTGDFERDDVNPEIGGNLRVGFTNISLDATINPDFSQVEADVGQVVINERFALFFPEKRPFFLEGIELFATPNNLVHTRQIVDPIAGGKVTGKVGPIGVAHLTAVDQAGDGPDALFNVARLRRDFGRNSTLGFLFTDRTELEGSFFNRVAAADARVVFGGLYYVEAQLGSSWTEDAFLEGNGTIGKLEFDRTGRSWGFNYRLTRIDDEFITRAGFVPRNGIVEASAFNRLSYYGATGALVETVTTFFGPNILWNHDDFGSDPIEGRTNARTSVRLRGGWELSANLKHNFVDLDASDYALFSTLVNGNVVTYTPLEDVSGFGLDLGVNTPTYQLFDAGISIGTGRAAIFPEGGEGNEWGISGDVNLRPTESLRVNASTTLRRLNRERDGSEFARTILPRLAVEFQPTRAFFLRAITEYRAERQAQLRDARTGAPLTRSGIPTVAIDNNGMRFDLLASYEPVPGTVAFFGYGSTLREPETLRFRRIDRTEDGFFFKVAYLFRR